MSLTRSAADECEVAEYMHGACHVFAVALHRMTGWPVHVVLDQEERYWEDPCDSDNWIPSVVHAYCVDPLERAWDVLGCRPLGEAREELEAMFGIGEFDSDRVGSEGELQTYVGCWSEEGEDPIDRPLEAYGEDDVKAAAEVAERVLANVEGFDQNPPPAP